MKFSSRSHYGLRAMISLAGSYPGGPVPLADIARAEGISLSYLEQLMACLRKAGVVESTRGVYGGYQLAADPSSITVGKVFRALEGPIDLAECATEVDKHGSCEREMVCLSRTFWENMRNNIARMLDETTLADLSGGGEVKVR